MRSFLRPGDPERRAEDYMDRITELLRADILTPLLMRAAHTSGLLTILEDGATMTELQVDGFQNNPTISLLGYLRSLGIVEVESESGSWRLTRAVRDSFANDTADIVHSDQFGTRIEFSARSFDRALKCESPAYEIEHGENFWDDLSRDRASLRRFHDQLTKLAFRLGAECANHLNWHENESLLDIGGSTGSFGRALLEQHPDLQYAVFDDAQLGEPSHKTAGNNDKADAPRLIRGDMFTDRPPAADTYVLCQVLHDWNDESVRSIIQNICYEKFRRLVVVERNCKLSSPAPIQRMSVRMALLFGSRERSVQEYEALLAESADLALYSSTPLPMGFVALEFCRDGGLYTP